MIEIDNKIKLSSGNQYIHKYHHISFGLYSIHSIFSCIGFLSIYMLLSFLTEDVFSHLVHPYHFYNSCIHIFAHKLVHFWSKSNILLNSEIWCIDIVNSYHLLYWMFGVKMIILLSLFHSFTIWLCEPLLLSIKTFLFLIILWKFDIPKMMVLGSMDNEGNKCP